MAHSIAPNISSDLRYVVYFRVNVRQEGVHHPEPMLNIWTDYIGMKDVVEQFKGKEQQLLNQTNSVVLKPSYVDEYYRSMQFDWVKKDEEFAKLKREADQAFESHDWKKAPPLFEKLAAERKDDWEIQLKAACCFTFSPIDQDLPKGVTYILRIIEISPSTINGYTLLLQNLNRQKKYNEAYPWIEKFLSCYPSDDPSPILDGLKVIASILVHLNKETEFPIVVNKAKEVYPHLSDQLTKLIDGLELEKLWMKGTEWLHSPHKDLVYGQELFSKICTLNPKDYWATVMAGGCYQW